MWTALLLLRACCRNLLVCRRAGRQAIRCCTAAQWIPARRASELPNSDWLRWLANSKALRRSGVRFRASVPGLPLGTDRPPGILAAFHSFFTLHFVAFTKVFAFLFLDQTDITSFSSLLGARILIKSRLRPPLATFTAKW